MSRNNHSGLIILLLSLMITLPSGAQEIDTVRVEKIIRMETLIDSLRQQIRGLDSEIQRMKKEMVENASNVQQVLSLFDEDADLSVPEDQRSRRKRVDALLKAISERPGQLRFNGSAVVSLQSLVANPGENTTGVGSFDLFAHTSFGRNTLLFFDLEAVMGDGPLQGKELLTSLNGDAGSTQSPDGFDRVHLLEAWAEFTLFRKALTVDIGKIDLTNYFDNNRVANDETSQFLGASFINSAALAAPPSGPGLRIRTEVLNRFFLQGGVTTITASGNSLLEDLFRIGSIGVRLFPTTNWEANIRLYGYQHPGMNKASGWGMSYDEAVGKRIELFLRFGQNNTRLSEFYGIAHARSCGVTWSGRLADRKLKIGAALGETKTGESDPHSEVHFEWYVRHQLNQWSYFSAHYQILKDSSTNKNIDHLIGCRVNFNF